MDLEWVVEKFIALIPIIGSVTGAKKEIADEALTSVSKALTETSIYVDRYIEKHQCDQDIEADLCRYWRNAAIPLRHFDKELAQICEYKAQYWLNPKNWDDSKTNGIAIDLETVSKRYENLLLGRKEP